jgi:GT2 family glycosyltransferase
MSEAVDRRYPAGTRVRVSAVIPTKNRKEMLRRVLRALQQQTVRSEIICVDDGSTDGTATMLRTEFPQVKMLRHDLSRGPAAARIAGAKASNGKFLVSLMTTASWPQPMPSSGPCDSSTIRLSPG